MRKPNILLITTDQQRADHLGIKGLNAIRTPHLDRLATEGVHFDRAYCPSPICTPTRVSLMTGKWPSSHGAYSIGVSVHPFPAPTLPELLSEAGYETVLLGKGHFVRRADEAAHMLGEADPDPSDFRSWTGPYLGFEHVETCIGHTINCKPDMHYRIFLEDQAGEYQQWFPQFHEGYNPLQTGVWDIPEELTNTAWVSRISEQWIRERKKGKPWFGWVSFEDPHEPFVCSEPWYSSVDASKLPVLEGARDQEFQDKPKIYEDIYKGQLKMYNDGHNVPCVYGHKLGSKEIAQAMQATLGMIAHIDAKIGSLLKTLKDTGQLEDTVIIFTSDHGEMHGHHGFWGKGLTAYEDCQKVPLLIWGPQYFSQTGTTSAIVNLVDIPTTILTLAGLEPSPGMQGTDLMPILLGHAGSVQDATIVECRATACIYQQTFVTERYKLVLYEQSNDGELYDLESDPDQYQNLWATKEFATLKAELLEQWVRFQMKREGELHPRKSFA